MSNNFFNFNQHGQHPLRNDQNHVACRLCNQVFPSFQALIIHTESHLAQANLSRGRRFSFPSYLINPRRRRRQLINNPTTPLQQRTITRANSMATPNPRATTTMSQPIRSRQIIPPEPIPSSVSFVAEMERLTAASSVSQLGQMEVSLTPSDDDGTMALINQLDRPMPINNNSIEFINMVDHMNGENPPELLALNLELRL